MFNVKPSTVPTRLIPGLYAHKRRAHPERFLRAETPRRPNTPQQLAPPFKPQCVCVQRHAKSLIVYLDSMIRSVWCEGRAAKEQRAAAPGGGAAEGGGGGD